MSSSDSMLSILKKIDSSKLEEYTNDLWKLTYSETIELIHHYIKKLINKEKVDIKLKVRWHEINNKYKDAFLSEVRTHLFITGVGSGKSVTSTMWAKFLTMIYRNVEGFVILSAEYEHGTEEIQRIILKYGNEVQYIYFKGKNKICERLETPINKTGTTVGQSLENGISCSRFCEKECDNKNLCEYRGNCAITTLPVEQGGIKNWISVQAQLKYYLPIFLYYVNDIVLIIDENFMNALKVSVQYDISIIQDNLEFLNDVLKGIDKEIDLKGVKNEQYREFVSLLKTILEKFKFTLQKEESQLNYEKIMDLFNSYDTLSDDAYLSLLNEQAYDYIKMKNCKAFKFIYGQLYNFTRNYFEYDERVEPEVAERWLKNAFYRKWYKKKKKWQISFFYYDKFSFLSKIIDSQKIFKVIINDATTDKEDLERFFDYLEPIEEHIEEWMYENCIIHQLKKQRYDPRIKQLGFAQYPKSSFFYKKTFDYLMLDLKEIMFLHINDPILVVTREIKPEEYITKKMKDGTKIKLYFKEVSGGKTLTECINELANGMGHKKVFVDYYPLKSTNEYADCKIGVILMKPELDQKTMYREATAQFSEENKYRKKYAKSEIWQAMGRLLRDIEFKIFYIFPYVELPESVKSTNIRYYSGHRALSDYIGVQQKKMENEVYFEKIKTYLSSHNNEIVYQDYIELFNVSKPTAIKYLNNLVINKKLKFKSVFSPTKKGKPKTVYFI